MKTKKILFTFIALLFCMNIQAQTWNIGYPTATRVTATLVTDTLTISGTGNMRDFINWERPPWWSQRANIKTVIIEDGVTNIGNWAFEYLTNLMSVSIGNSITSIGSFAFLNTTSLVSAVIPNSVTSIGRSAFQNTGLVSVVIPNSVTFIGRYALGYNRITNLVIADGIETLYFGTGVSNNSDIFRLSRIENVYLGRNISRPDPNHPFTWGRNSIRTLTIGNYVETIPNDAFSNSVNLTSVIIGEGVTSIGNSAFRGCRSLTSLTIPKNVTTIGESAFADCLGLLDIYVYWDIPIRISTSVFAGLTHRDIILHIPQGTLSAYQDTPVWRDFTLRERDAETSVSIINNDNIQLHTTSQGILIETRKEVQVAVFSISGALLYQSAVSGSREIALSAGAYIVRVNGESEKVIVR